MSRLNLSFEEQDILDTVESGNYTSVLDAERAETLKQIAKNTFKKDKRINIRISSSDLLAIQSRASIEGIPYQTLVSR